MLHQTNLSQAAQPIPYANGAALDAITAELDKLPASTRNATLDQIATATPSLAAWRQARDTFRQTMAAEAAADENDDTAFTAARDAAVHAQIALLTMPAPTIKELGEKVSIYFEIAADEFQEPAIGASITADVARLLPKQAVGGDQAWSIAAKALDDVKARLATRGLTDEAVDTLTNEETAATDTLLALTSRNAADVIAKVRALSGLNTMVAVADLEPLMVELEALTVTPAPATDADRTLLDAFATYRAEYRNLKEMPMDITDEEEAAQWGKIDPAIEVLVDGRAETVAGVLAKATLAFTGMEGDRWIDDTIVEPGSTGFSEGLRLADFYTRMMWSAIEDLSRISGVDLADAA